MRRADATNFRNTVYEHSSVESLISFQQNIFWISIDDFENSVGVRSESQSFVWEFVREYLSMITIEG